MKAARLLSLIALSAACAAPALADDVTVTLTGVRAQGGEVLVALQTQDQFLKPAGAYGVKAAAPAQDGAVTLTIKGVAPGRYSLSVLHDADGDMTMKMRPDGMPAEGWAMHRGAELHAAPTFDFVSFDVGARPVALTEAMIYPQ